MLRDLSDVWGWLQRILRRLDRAESGAMLENASITSGRLRLIGGLLLIDSGGTLRIVGTVDGQGNFRWSGPWQLQGDGTITGDVKASGEFTQIGPWHLNGAGSIAGDVDITGDLNLLADLIVSSVGRVRVGNMTLDPSSNGGSMKFAGGPEVYASGSELSLYSGIGSFITLNGSSAKLNGPGARWVEVTAGGFRLVGLPKVTKAGIPAGCIYKGTDGFLYEG